MSTCRSWATKMAVKLTQFKMEPAKSSEGRRRCEVDAFFVLKKYGSLFEKSSCVSLTKLFLSLNHSWLEERLNVVEDVERIEQCSTLNKPSNGNTSY